MRVSLIQANGSWHTLLGITAGISVDFFCGGRRSVDRFFKGTPGGDPEVLLDTRTNFERRFSFRFVAHVARRFLAACADRIDIAALRFGETLARKRHPVVVIVATRFQSGCAVVVAGENGSELAARTSSPVSLFCFSFALETGLRIAANPLRACNQIRAAPFGKNSAITGCYFLLRVFARGRFLWLRRILLLLLVILCHNFGLFLVNGKSLPRFPLNLMSCQDCNGPQILGGGFGFAFLKRINRS